MLVIRTEQMRALDDSTVSTFIARLRAHCRVHAAAEVGPMTDAQFDELARYAVRRAAAHGLSSEAGVCMYLHVMLRCGRDFDQDPQCAWANEILADRYAGDPLKAEYLLDRCWEVSSAPSASPVPTSREPKADRGTEQ